MPDPEPLFSLPFDFYILPHTHTQLSKHEHRLMRRELRNVTKEKKKNRDEIIVQ